MSDLFHDPMILRQIIMDHYQYPRNHQLSEDSSYVSLHMVRESCIDDITVQAKLNEGRLEDIRFDGVACTISTASTSIMTELLKNKTKEEALLLINEYFKMIDEQEYDETALEEAVAFHNVGKQANRIKCATIGWQAIKEILEQEDDDE